MKKTKLLTKSGNLLNILYLICLLLTVAACDSLESDTSPKIPATGTTNEVYVQANGSSLIDLSTLVGSNQRATVAVTSSTTQGTLSDLGAGIIQYKPTSGSRDGFEITVTTADNVVTKDTVVLLIQDSVNLPCGIYPKEDIVFGATENQPIQIDVLSNDNICGYALNELELSIKTGDSFPPYFGSASVNSNNITYTSNKDFTSADKIVYKITVKNNPAIVAYGLVYLVAQPACNFIVRQDSLSSNEEFTQIRIKGLDNDSLCNAVNSFQVTISSTPANGSVYVESDEFVYSPTNLATNGFTDSFEYTICIDGTCKSARVTVKVNTQ